MKENSRTEQFLLLYGREQRQLYSMIRAMLFRCDKDAVDEVFQETWLTLWRSFDDFTPGTNFLAWAVQIARHRVLAYQKEHKTKRLQFPGDVINLIAEDIHEESELLTERARALVICMQKMSDRDRDIIQRRYQKNMKASQLAQEIGRPLDSLYRSLRRIRRSLLQCIDRVIVGDGGGK